MQRFRRAGPNVIVWVFDEPSDAAKIEAQLNNSQSLIRVRFERIVFKNVLLFKNLSGSPADGTVSPEVLEYLWKLWKTLPNIREVNFEPEEMKTEL